MEDKMQTTLELGTKKNPRGTQKNWSLNTRRSLNTLHSVGLPAWSSGMTLDCRAGGRGFKPRSS